MEGYKGTVFVVEDEPLILLELRQMLTELGWWVAAIASEVDKAVALANSEEFDIGILDVNVRGRSSLVVAKILESRNIPVILATGYSTEIVVASFPDAIFLQKPYLKDDLNGALNRVVSSKEQPRSQSNRRR
jgi:DNA-binding NtrC family response regulator